ncbi:hypothetical protein EV174_002258 [Coemansia sp. RSA 2320]|nr:hypothetical protein EV174_002258 [Coemansia sp. RSA 2320]
MLTAVPEYILSSGITAQRARGRRSSLASVASSTQSAQQAGAEEMDELFDATIESPSEIKSVLGFISSAQRGWPQHVNYDTPRLVHF